MPVLFTFAVLTFAACCIAQFWFVQRVASALEARHPEKYRAMRTLFFTNRIYWFAITRSDRRLGDPELTKRVKPLRGLAIVALLSWLCIACLLMTGHAPKPGSPTVASAVLPS
jgi:hypothetical protein